MSSITALLDSPSLSARCWPMYMGEHSKCHKGHDHGVGVYDCSVGYLQLIGMHSHTIIIVR